MVNDLKDVHHDLLFGDGGAIFGDDDQQELLYHTPCMYDDRTKCSDSYIASEFGSVDAVSHLTGLDSWLSSFISTMSQYATSMMLEMPCTYGTDAPYNRTVMCPSPMMMFGHSALKGPLRDGLGRSIDLYRETFEVLLREVNASSSILYGINLFISLSLVISVMLPFLKVQRRNSETTRTMLLMIPSDTLKNVAEIMNYFKEKTRIISGIKVAKKSSSKSMISTHSDTSLTTSNKQSEPAAVPVLNTQGPVINTWK